MSSLTPFSAAFAAALACLVPLGAAVMKYASAIALYQNSQNLLLLDTVGRRVSSSASWIPQSFAFCLEKFSCSRVLHRVVPFLLSLPAAIVSVLFAHEVWAVYKESWLKKATSKIVFFGAVGEIPLRAPVASPLRVKMAY